MNHLSRICLLLIHCSVNVCLCCVCTQPLNPQFLCVDQSCESEDNLGHHYCNSNYVIKVMVTSDKLFSAIPGTFITKVGYRYKLVHTYKVENNIPGVIESGIVWTSQDSCGISLKKSRLYIISGAIDKDRITARTSACDFVKAVKDLTLNEINFFGHKHKALNCSQLGLSTVLAPDMVINSTSTPDVAMSTDMDVARKGQITTPPVIQDKSCYCGPSGQSSAVPVLSAINIGLGAANNNGENGWHNIDGGLNVAIASGNGNTGKGIGSVNANGVVCAVKDGSNGNGGVNIGIASANNNGGNGWNVGNGGNSIDGSGKGIGGSGIGGHNVGNNAGNGNGGTNIGLISGNWNGGDGWHVGNGGNNADDNSYNSYVNGNNGKGKPGTSAQSSGNGFGTGGNNVGDSSGNGEGGNNWGFWSGNGNGINGWSTGNGGNNAGDNVGNGQVVFDDEFVFSGHNSGTGGNNRGNNTGNGKGGINQGLGSGLNNGNSNWNSGNGGNNVGDGSGNGLVGPNSFSPSKPKSPRPATHGKRPGAWSIGVGNGGNNIGTGSGNGFGGKSLSVEEINGLKSAENKVNDNEVNRDLNALINEMISEFEIDNRDNVFIVSDVLESQGKSKGVGN